jgi:hypothetical protein
MSMKKIKGFKITDSQQHTLIGTLLFGKTPIVFQASVTALKKAGFMTVDRYGNLELTAVGMEVALQLLQHKSAGIVSKTKSKIAKLKKVA